MTKLICIVLASFVSVAPVIGQNYLKTLGFEKKPALAPPASDGDLLWSGHAAGQSEKKLFVLWGEHGPVVETFGDNGFFVIVPENSEESRRAFKYAALDLWIQNEQLKKSLEGAIEAYRNLIKLEKSDPLHPTIAPPVYDQQVDGGI